VSFGGDPAQDGRAVRYWPDGVVGIDRDGRISAVGDARDVMASLPLHTPIDHYPEDLILPGLIDTHVHYVQAEVIASFGAQLLDWLNNYTFVAEQKFSDPAIAAHQARFFLDELLRNGTTTALIYCSVHPQSVDALFAEAERRHIGVIAGKVMMDRNAPGALIDSVRSSYNDSKALIGRWHGRGRLRYAITPRFAITSTPEQLEAAAMLKREHPDCHLQTHLAENLDEIATTLRLYPQATSYTDVYHRFGLLGPRTVLGHCIHLAEAELAVLSATRSVGSVLPDLEPVSRVRTVQLRGHDRPAPTGARRDGKRRRRRHQLLDAAHRQRGLQGPGAARHKAARLPGVPHDDTGKRRSARAGARDRQPGGRALCRPRGARLPGDAGDAPAHGGGRGPAR